MWVYFLFSSYISHHLTDYVMWFYYFLFYFEVLHSCCVFSFPPFVGFPALFLYSPVSCLLISLCVYSLMSLPWCCHGFCVFFFVFFFGLLLKFPLCSQLCLPPESLAFGSSLFLPIVTYRYSVVLCQNCNYIFLLSLCCHHFFKQPSDKLFKGALSLFDQYSQKCKVQYHNPFVFSGSCGPITCNPCKMQLILSKQTSISLLLFKWKT